MSAESVNKPQDNLVLQMVDGVKLNLPRSIRYLSTFVLQEQGDWFEDEVKFLRKILAPGMKVLDIGANFGAYTLAMAKVIGPDGAVWAFEPASNTAMYLRKSVALNKFDHVTVIEKGLSDHQGEATFHLSVNSELNSLQSVNREVATETVELTTLDVVAKEYNFPELDFIKLDAEGEESKIIDASRELLSTMSPLVMFELKHAKQVNLALIQQLSALGYKSFRLVPGLDILMPFDDTQKPDPYQLNLFCCKDDRAERLEAQGVLVRQLEGLLVDARGSTRKLLVQLTFPQRLDNAEEWLKSEPTSFENTLDFYVASLDETISTGQRLACLRRAMVLSVLQTPNGGRQNVMPIEQAATHARIALAGGQRQRAVNLLLEAIGSNDGVTKLQPAMPFLPASARYDLLDPGDRFNRWLVSSVIEQWVIHHAYSSYFTGRKALPALKRLNTLGFIDARMKRRLELVSKMKLN